MASLTIRQLDEATKAALKLRAAKNGRSMEDEVRTILRDSADPADSPPAPTSAHPPTYPQAVDRTSAPRRTALSGSRRVLLIIGGGIAAYKALDLIRRLKERGCHVRCALTQGAQQFVTPLAATALADERCYTDLFDATSEFDAGHIRLARESDLIIVAPATADLMAKMAHGIANDLASAILLAAKGNILVAPAMNPAMWSNAATRRNAKQLAQDGIAFIGPNSGEMAEKNEGGVGRMAEPLEIAARADAMLTPTKGALAGRRIVITAGPTQEPIDPVRYISNRSSGKQGYAIAQAAAQAGAQVVLVSGPVDLPDPRGVEVVHIESARDMLAKVEAALPADIAIFAAAVADWRVERETDQKIKKQTNGAPPALALTENPDILRTISHGAQRPGLVIGFAAETQNLLDNAKAKLARKGCDWIVANDVSPQSGVMGGDDNTIHIVTRDGVEPWPTMTKTQVATKLIERIATELKDATK